MLFLYGWKNVTARLAIGLVCVAEEYIVDYSLMIIIYLIKNNNNNNTGNNNKNNNKKKIIIKAIALLAAFQHSQIKIHYYYTTLLGNS